MKLDQNRLMLIGLIAGVIIAGALLAWVVLSKNPIGASLPKTFSQELHNGLATELEGNGALVQDLDDLPIPENRKRFFLLQNVARSYQSELEWLNEKETLSFETLQGTENNLVGQEALRKEIAYYIVFQYLQQVNLKVTDDISADSFDSEEAIRLAEQEIPVLEANPLVPASKIRGFAQEAGISEEQIRQGIQNELREFLDFKKQAFADSVTSFEKAVIGQQIITWQYVLQAANTN